MIGIVLAPTGGQVNFTCSRGWHPI